MAVLFSPDEQARITCLLLEAEGAELDRRHAIADELEALIGPERLKAFLAGDKDSHCDLTGWKPPPEIYVRLRRRRGKRDYFSARRSDRPEGDQRRKDPK